MALKVSTDDFAYEVKKLLGEYQQGLYTQLEPVMRKTANEARKELRRTSPKGDSGKYRRGWEYSIKVSSRMGGGQITLYNGPRPGLTHLLENGHAVRNGTGRNTGKQFTDANPHIAAANEYAQKQFLENLQLALGEAPLNFV